METVLETESLILRPWRMNDLGQLIDGLNNIDVARWLAFVPHPYSQADGLKWLDHCQRLPHEVATPAAYEFAVERKVDHAMIGGVSLNAIDEAKGTAGGGIWINAAYHRQGYGREAFGERIRFAFDTLHLREIRNGYFRGNEPSWELQRQFGYRHTDEAPRPRLCLADGARRDEILTSLRVENWVRN